jgi:hypothetical protein
VAGPAEDVRPSVGWDEFQGTVQLADGPIEIPTDHLSVRERLEGKVVGLRAGVFLTNNRDVDGGWRRRRIECTEETYFAFPPITTEVGKLQLV